MKRLGLAAQLISSCLLLSAPAAGARAQSGRVRAEPAEPPRAEAVEPPQKVATSGGLAVEIVFDDGRRSYIPGKEKVWFGRFQTVAGYARPAHISPVQAVQVASRFEGEAALHITVSVLLGEKHLDEDRAVATFVAREGDELVVEGLREFGVVPIGLRVVRARTPPPPPPYVESRTRSLELLGVEPVDVSFPSYKVRLRNLTGKTISAMQVLYVKEDGGRRVQWVHNPRNEPLAEAGAVYDLNASGGYHGRMLPDGYAPDFLRKVTIGTVVFSDGTFEGDEGGAAWMNALWRGRKAQLERALPLVRRALEAPEAAGAIKRFRAQVAALERKAEPSEFAPLLARFPRLTGEPRERMLDTYEFSLHKVRLDLLDALKRFELANRDDPERMTFRVWLGKVRGVYEQWLSRL